MIYRTLEWLHTLHIQCICASCARNRDTHIKTQIHIFYFLFSFCFSNYCRFHDKPFKELSETRENVYTRNCLWICMSSVLSLYNKDFNHVYPMATICICCSVATSIHMSTRLHDENSNLGRHNFWIYRFFLFFFFFFCPPLIHSNCLTQLIPTHDCHTTLLVGVSRKKNIFIWLAKSFVYRF